MRKTPPNQEPIMTFRYFYVYQLPQIGKRRTRDYEILSRPLDKVLGYLNFYSPWRQHILRSEPNTIWNAECLKDVQIILVTLKKREIF